jgi:hypothetical protein
VKVSTRSNATSLPAAIGQERVEVAAAIVLKDDRLVVDHRLVRGGRQPPQRSLRSDP